MTKKIRLIKVTVQPMLVVDDGEGLEELQVAPLVVPAHLWPQFSTEGWAELIGQLEAELEGGST